MSALRHSSGVSDVRDDRNRVAPPDEASTLSTFGARQRRSERIDQMSRDRQWLLIGSYLRENPAQQGLLGEAINEHHLSGAIAAARIANDHDAAARLIELAQRQYLVDVIQNERDARDGQ